MNNYFQSQNIFRFKKTIASSAIGFLSIFLAIPLANEVKADDFNSYMATGQSLQSEGNHVDAIPYFNTVIQLYPDHPDTSWAYVLRATSLVLLGFEEDGCNDLRQATLLKGDGAETARGALTVAIDNGVCK